MSDRNVTSLRSYLFDELERLANPSLTGEKLAEEIERAKIIQQTAGRIIETAKAQTDRMKVLGEMDGQRDTFLEGQVTGRQITQEKR